jgi:transposase
MMFELLVLPGDLPTSHQQLYRYYERCHCLEQQVEELETRVEQYQRNLATLERKLFGSRRERFVNEASEDGERASSVGDSEASTTEHSSEPTPVSPPADVVTPTPPQGSSPPSADDAIAPSAGGSESPTTSPAPNTTSKTRTSKGRRKRVIDPSIAREQAYHRLNEQDVPPEVWNHPQAKRFFRLVREEVELQERRIRVIEHFEEVIVVEDEHTTDTKMVAASAPEPFIDRCYLGTEFLAYLVASRFADHIPYYREEDILARIGFPIHRATQWRWMRGLAGQVSPLVQLMHEQTLLSGVLGMDETPIPLICPERAATRSAYLYAQYGDAAHPYVSFHYAPHKTAENIQRMLGNYQGCLQSDAYICYELIAAAASDRIRAAGCWCHARRKFEPLVADTPHPQATWILRQIQKLYDIEDRAHAMTDAERLTLRQAESTPIVEDIKRWLDERHERELPRSPLREGVNYLRNRWKVFQRFLEDGAIPMDNNRTEASIKGPVIGKKNWLHIGNDKAGETAAILYTLVMTCKRHCIDVQAYLSDVFRRIRGAARDELEALLPDRWLQSHPEARVMQRVQESKAAANRKRERRARRRAVAAAR